MCAKRVEDLMQLGEISRATAAVWGSTGTVTLSDVKDKFMSTQQPEEGPVRRKPKKGEADTASRETANPGTQVAGEVRIPRVVKPIQPSKQVTSCHETSSSTYPKNLSRTSSASHAEAGQVQPEEDTNIGR